MDPTISGIEIRQCDAGFRNYNFVKLTTSDGVVGWSEYDEGFGSPGVTTVIEQLAHRLTGRSVMAHERVFTELTSATRPATGGVVAQGLGAIENAMLDAKAKTLGVPCYDLLGGKVRDRIRVYWSHCASWRIGFPDLYGGHITDLAGVRAMGEEVRDRGFTALKTNVFTYESGSPRSWIPGFGYPSDPGMNVERSVLRDAVRHLEAFREGAGADVDIMIDLNFNARTEGYLQFVRAFADLELFWIEIDLDHAPALATVRSRSDTPISGCETLLGLSEFLPYFAEQAVDVAIVDAVWNGVWQSMKIASAAAAHEVNIAPHNFYGHLSTMMNAHFAAAVPNLRIMETDVDRLPWDSDLFTVEPPIENGHLVIPDTPGWGTEPIEEALAAHPPQENPGFLVNRRRS